MLTALCRKIGLLAVLRCTCSQCYIIHKHRACYLFRIMCHDTYIYGRGKFSEGVRMPAILNGIEISVISRHTDFPSCL